MRRVLIGTPAYDWRCDVRYINSLTGTIRLCMESGIFLREVFLAGDAIVQNARNDLVKLAIDNDFDDLVFIDSDQDWEPAWFVRLLSHPVDCVGGAVRRKTDEHEMYNVKALGGPESIITDPNTGLMTAPDMALGTGFLRFTRKALRALWDNAPEYSVFMGTKGKSRWIFDIRPVNGELVGEDTMVSDRLRELGIQTWLDPTITCGHVGLKRFEGNFADFLERAKADRAKPNLAVVK